MQCRVEQTTLMTVQIITNEFRDKIKLLITELVNVPGSPAIL